MKIAARFPQEIYVTKEDDGGGGTFLAAHDNINDPAVIGERVEVAIYELKRTAVVTTTPVLQP